MKIITNDGALNIGGRTVGLDGTSYATRQGACDAATAEAIARKIRSGERVGSVVHFGGHVTFVVEVGNLHQREKEVIGSRWESIPRMYGVEGKYWT